MGQYSSTNAGDALDFSGALTASYHLVGKGPSTLIDSDGAQPYLGEFSCFRNVTLTNMPQMLDGSPTPVIPFLKNQFVYFGGVISYSSDDRSEEHTSELQ